MNIELAEDEVACLRNGNVPASVRHKLRGNVKVELTPEELDFVASIVGGSIGLEKNKKLLEKLTSLGASTDIEFAGRNGYRISYYREIK